MAVIGINYSGGNTYDDDDNIIENPIEYKSVYLHYSNGEEIFNSGDFIKDWADAKKFFSTKLMDKEFAFSQSSSVDHFFMDGANYDSAYLHVVEEKPVLKYLDKKDPNYLYTQKDVYNGWEFFVEKDTKPTWEELKKICKQ
jgi:hypothetical protein